MLLEWLQSPISRRSARMFGVAVRRSNRMNERLKLGTGRVALNVHNWVEAVSAKANNGSDDAVRQLCAPSRSLGIGLDFPKADIRSLNLNGPVE